MRQHTLQMACKLVVHMCMFYSNGGGSYLLAALDDIEGADGCVSKTAGQHTTAHALEVVRKVVNVAHYYNVFFCFSFFFYFENKI